MGKLDRIPVAVVRGFELTVGGDGSGDGASSLVREPARDLFR